jgi:hypothetical protein
MNTGKIQAPSWCKNAIPTYRGWEHPTTGELFASRGFTPEQIAEWHGNLPEPVAPQPSLEEELSPEPEVITLTEAPANNKPLEKMSKVQLESLGRQHGIELDRRKSKKTLVETMKDLLED